MLSFAWLALLSIIFLNFPCFKVHFCTLSLCEANSKEWIMFQFFTRISFVQEMLQVETLLLARANNTHLEIGPQPSWTQGAAVPFLEFWNSSCCGLIWNFVHQPKIMRQPPSSWHNKAILRQAQSMNMKCGGNFCFENFKTLKLLFKTLKL